MKSYHYVQYPMYREIGASCFFYLAIFRKKWI